MSDTANKAQGWVAVVLAAIPGIKQLVDLLRDDTTHPGYPCRLRFRKKHGYTKCRTCGQTFMGHAGDRDDFPEICPLGKQGE